MIKKIFLLSIFMIAFACDNKKEIKQTAEISCGQCQFNLVGDGCDLAVRFNNKAYFVDGFGIDDFGDAHDKQTGFCEVIRFGEVKGYLKDDKFLASDIKLLK
ncbi:DUF6370 family protein [Polaribacter reichenbachii]|uniref:DUF6370 family protein n=1 Tax=Polaribacter reichenbachii TaxID=996801 RepID=UPI000B0A21C8|nr:DUF6370 family protein [Polaribacter reichenbachii]